MKLLVIIGSTRPGRVTPLVANWVVSTAKAMEDVEVEVVDLIDYPMPFFDEPISPRYNPDRHIGEEAGKFVNKIAEGDAYIFVTPEYNHSITGVLKNAIDYLTFELTHKPAMIVSHGSVGGARAAMTLKYILSESQAAVMPKSVAVVGANNQFDEDGELKPEIKAQPYGMQTALDGALTDLKWYSDALSAARG